MFYVYTCAASNYLPKVKLLFDSVKKFHPDWTTYLALADKPTPDLKTNNVFVDDFFTLDMLPINNADSWIFLHNVAELSTAIKPFALLHLLNKPDCEGVIYLDPDIVVFSPLHDLIDHLKSSNILLTPHLTKPDKSLPGVGAFENERATLKHGTFNLGFLAVSPSAETRKFAEWWAERLYHFCIADWTQGLFTDQRWIDLVPAFFDGVTILKSSRFNVAPWNLPNRVVDGNWEEGFTVDNQPLGFYHFTGFDSGAHVTEAKRMAPDNESVAALISWYTDSIKPPTKNTPKIKWAYSHFDNGILIDEFYRKIYRQRTDLQKAYPHPFFTATPDSYYYWLMNQGVREYPEKLKMPLNQGYLKKHLVKTTKKVAKLLKGS